MVLGIVCGLLAATLQAVSYIFSRDFVGKHGSAVQLFFASQTNISIATLFMVPFLAPWRYLSLEVLIPIAIAGACFVGGQIFFFMAVRKIEASRISSLMGLKVVVVPLLLFVLFKEVFSLGQVIAFTLAMASAFVMNYHGGGRFNFSGMGVLGLCILCYSGCDIAIQYIMGIIQTDNVIHTGLVAIVLNNLFIGIVIAPVSFRTKPKVLRRAIPYALAIGLSVLCLFLCFGMIGAAFGNIIQAIRGPISLVLGMIIAAKGLSDLEEKVETKVWVRRGIAATLMVISIILYAIVK